MPYFIIQLYSEKYTGQYFKIRDDARLVFKIGVIIYEYIQNYIYKNYSKTYVCKCIHIFIFLIKLKHNMNIFFFVNSIERWTDETAFVATFG